MDRKRRGHQSKALHDVGAGAKEQVDALAEFVGEALEQKIDAATVETIVPPIVSIENVIVVEGQNGASVTRFEVSLVGDHDDAVHWAKVVVDSVTTGLMKRNRLCAGGRVGDKNVSATA